MSTSSPWFGDSVSLVPQAHSPLAIQNWHSVVRSVLSQRKNWSRSLKPHARRCSLSLKMSLTTLWRAWRGTHLQRPNSGPKKLSRLVLKPVHSGVCVDRGDREVMRGKEFQVTQEVVINAQQSRKESSRWSSVGLAVGWGVNTIIPSAWHWRYTFLCLKENRSTKEQKLDEPFTCVTERTGATSACQNGESEPLPKKPPVFPS